MEIRPPAARGDVLAALADDPATIVLLDGYYYSVPAVTHKELLYALHAGTRVIGAASMGALRAAEMERFGMIGVGQVFRWFRSGALDGDDEVAILHAPGVPDYAAATLALVEIRFALHRLIARGAIPGSAAGELVRRLKVIAFTERHPERVAAWAAEELGPSGAAALQRELAADSIKLRDAEAAVREARGQRWIRPAPRRPMVTVYLNHFREWYLRPSASDPRSRRRTCLKAWSMIQLLHPGAPAFVAAVRRRYLLVSAARSAGLVVPAGRVTELVEALRASLAPPARRLPAAEITEEAEHQALAEAACRHYGGAAAACRAVAAAFAVAPSESASFLRRLLHLQDDLVPPWLLARAASFSTAFEAAADVAEAALQVYEAFRAWSRGALVAEDDAMAVAVALWSCPGRMVATQAARRGLFRAHTAHGFAPGLRGAVEMIAVAERLLEEPVNDYPSARSRLRSTPLRYPLPLTFTGRRRPAVAAGIHAW